MKNNQIAVGLTGGIGSGKSFVANLLEQEGYPVYYTDKEARRLMNESREIHDSLSALVGKDAYLPDGHLNKNRMSAFVFADKSNAERVNRIVHPVVRDDFKHWVSSHAEPLLFMECAILYESGFNDLVQRVVAVTAPDAVRLKRVTDRDQCTEEQAASRMRLQMSTEELCRRADFVIVNDGQQDVAAAINGIIKALSLP